MQIQKKSTWHNCDQKTLTQNIATGCRRLRRHKSQGKDSNSLRMGRQPAVHSLPAQGIVLTRSSNQSHQDTENNNPTEVVSLHMPLKTSFQCLILKSIFRNILMDHLIWNSNPRKSSSTGLHSPLRVCRAMLTWKLTAICCCQSYNGKVSQIFKYQSWMQKYLWALQLFMERMEI